MSILQQEDEVKVFPCPQCKRTISSLDNTCRYCGSTISSEARALAIGKQEEENRDHHIGIHKNMALIGVAVLIVGLFLLVQSILAIYQGGIFFIWSPVITLVGLGQIIYGLNGIRKERKGK